MEGTKNVTETAENVTKTEEPVDQQTGGLSEAARKNRLMIMTRLACNKAIHADDQALKLWEAGRLTEEMFKAITGHGVADALKLRYIENRVNASYPLRRQAAAGGITTEEFADAIGVTIADGVVHPDVPDEALVLAINQVLGGIDVVPVIDPAPQPEDDPEPAAEADTEPEVKG